MVAAFFEPASEARAEIEVRKSRFIGTVRKVVSPGDAGLEVRREKGLHPDARHVVYAFIIGDPKSETAGMSDDGEPKGTAGRPVLEVLKGSGVRNALVTVTRYFGGTKLGTGGLVRAYTECAQAALRITPVLRVRAEKRYRITMPYDCFEPVKHILRPPDCRIENESFGEQAEISVYIADEAVEGILDAVRDIARGRAEIAGEDG